MESLRVPIPNGIEQIIGAIQWIDLGEAVHAKANSPYNRARCRSVSDVVSLVDLEDGVRCCGGNISYQYPLAVLIRFSHAR
jgi:hypothetical protein